MDSLSKRRPGTSWPLTALTVPDDALGPRQWKLGARRPFIYASARSVPRTTGLTTASPPWVDSLHESSPCRTITPASDVDRAPRWLGPQPRLTPSLVHAREPETTTPRSC
jgi:hypothetical protein